MITCVHGFLGLPEDWTFLRDAGLQIETPTIDAFLDQVRTPRPPGAVALGYSMGGRVVLQSLTEGAGFSRAIVISAGLNLESGREERRERDEAWARRFETEDWRPLLEAWDAQPLFGGHRFHREEADFDRKVLSEHLRRLSPGLLPPLLPRLRDIDQEILWVVGEKDAAYREVGQQAVRELRHGTLWVCPGAGHRVPWEQPETLIARIRAFLAG